MKTPNPIDVVEAAYDLDGDDRSWLAKVAEKVRPLIDGGRGVIAYVTHSGQPPASYLDDALLVAAPVEDLELARWILRAAPESFGRAHTEAIQPLATNSDDLVDPGLLASPALAEYAERLREYGVCDNARFGTVEPDGNSVNFVAAQLSPRRFDSRTKRLWARVAAHVAAARRLRGALHGEPDAAHAASGRVEYAAGEARDRNAREALRDAVLRQDKARGRMRREDPEGATEAWTALVAGRWSLVDRFERGGRRYIVARRNEHGLVDPRALSPRERAVAHLVALGKANKLVAYELGVAESTVANHLAAAMKKLGAASRVDLIQLLGAT